MCRGNTLIILFLYVLFQHFRLFIIWENPTCAFSPLPLKGTTVGATNTASVISTAPLVTTATSSPSLSPSPATIQSTTTDSKAGINAQTIVTQAPTSLATSLGTGQVMVAAPGLSAAQLPTSASFAAMAAAAGLNPGLMASSQFAPGFVINVFKASDSYLYRVYSIVFSLLISMVLSVFMFPGVPCSV